MSDYPNLGFDPTPGSVADVSALERSLSKAVTTLGEGSQLIENLRRTSGAAWQGDAADQFREHIDSKLPKALNNAHDSFDKARKALDSWAGDLATMQSKAVDYEAKAKTAREQLAAAESALASESSKTTILPADATPDVVARAQKAYDDAVGAAQGKVNDANGSLRAILEDATALQSSHNSRASEIARDIEGAPDDLAPEKPHESMWHKFSSWVGDHADDIADVLSDVSAVAGIVALVTPPPIDAIALGVSVVAGAGALGLHIATGGSGWEIAGDVVSVVPGIGILKEAAVGARAVETVADGVRFAREAESAADVAFGSRYAASAISDTAGQIVPATRNAVEEAKVLGSNMSRMAASGISAIPGITVNDGYRLAVNIDRTVAAFGGGIGVLDAYNKTPLPDVPGTDAAQNVSTSIGMKAIYLSLLPTVHL
jgi:hypothetical protein